MFVPGDLLKAKEGEGLVLVVQADSERLYGRDSSAQAVEVVPDEWVKIAHPQLEWPFLVLPQKVRNVAQLEIVHPTDSVALVELRDWVLGDGYRAGGVLYLRPGLVRPRDRVMVNGVLSLMVPLRFASFSARKDPKKPTPPKYNPFEMLDEE